jgi:hypothetical protein
MNPMDNPLHKYLTPHRRIEAYTRVILLEAKGTVDEMVKGADDIEIGKAELRHIGKHCHARTLWLIEKHPYDSNLIKTASKYAAQILQVTIHQLNQEKGGAKASALTLD